MKKSILKIEGVKQLTQTEQKAINGGTAGTCGRKNGNTGQSCTTDSQCSGANFPVCWKGCCNTWV